jgi:uncharacterized repeat protein (TIGR03803 family)
MRGKMLVTVAVTLLLVTCSWASSETLLYSLCSLTSCADGAYPYAGLVADSSGNLYGTAYQYGANSSFPYGVVFELKRSGGAWKQIVLHSFAGGPNDGAYPRAPLTFDTAGNLYGTTFQGGTKNYGTVFVMKHSGSKWTESVIHSFLSTSSTDGYYPYARVTFDAKGNLYGTTEYGGAHGVGTVFLMTQSKGKWTYKLIHGFAAGNDGAYPLGPITVGANGYYYGTTYNGGGTYNDGEVYRLFQARGVWVIQRVFSFTGGSAGANPDSGLAMDASGNFYGTTYAGGATNLGTVYKLKAGKNNTFTQRPTGRRPNSVLRCRCCTGHERQHLRHHPLWRFEQRWHGFRIEAKWQHLQRNRATFLRKRRRILSLRGSDFRQWKVIWHDRKRWCSQCWNRICGDAVVWHRRLGNGQFS